MRYLKVIVSSKAGSTLSSAAIEAARRVISTYTDIVPIGVSDNLYGRHIDIGFCVQIATDVKLLMNTIHEASNHITAVVAMEPGNSLLSDRFVISDYTDPGVGRFCAEYLVREEAKTNMKAAALIEGVAQTKKNIFSDRAMLRIELPGVFVLWMGGITTPNIDIIKQAKGRVQSTLSSIASGQHRKLLCSDDRERRLKFCQADESEFLIHSVKVPDALSLSTKALNHSEVMRNGGHNPPANLSMKQFAWVSETEDRVRKGNYVG